MCNNVNRKDCAKGNTFHMIRILSKQRHGLKICHINAQSLPKKIDEFRYFFESSNVDVVCVSETWFTPHHSYNLFHVSDYKLFRRDRIGHGGGVAMYVKNCLSCRLKCVSSNASSIEYIQTY